MTRFQIKAGFERNDTAGARTRLFAADRLLNPFARERHARTVQLAGVLLNAISGSWRVVGWMAPPQAQFKTGSGDNTPEPPSVRQHLPLGAPEHQAGRDLMQHRS